ncbi:MAG: bifunctional DNA-formamidopyrimidine glycosylase/DNA-(apurinic or apyrimidinic site) lyase [Candidatus Rifleibacteriota bacterium]
MPELPEVNTLVAALRHHLRGDSIVRWQKLSLKLRKTIPDEDDADQILKKPIREILRLGKSVFFKFSARQYLHVHLGMTGYFRLAAKLEPPGKHEHLRLTLSSGRILCYCDPRKFGVIELMERLPETGLEPFSGSLTTGAFLEICKNRKAAIKSVIMNQRLIAGLGNIYANEALFGAGINPCKPACELSLEEAKKLVQAIVEVTVESVNSGLASLPPAFVIDEHTTHFPVSTRVYGQEGSICKKCGSHRIVKTMVAGRSSFFCPACQN